ncbi:tetratricopeptide repeat protein [Scytonema sp. NUACC26]|uniref:tetratricopeptide repeat protein n=1 Tax=Scytonema sp. NUACC26 TaxID=3140176 RepID=UPI0034DC78B1
MLQEANFWINLGQQQLHAGNYGAALLFFDQAITRDLKNIDAWNERAIAIQKLDNAQEIISASNHSLATVLHERGKQLEEEKNYLEAIKSYDQALAIQPEFDEVRQSRKNALRNLSKPPLSLVIQRPFSPKPLSYLSSFTNTYSSASNNVFEAEELYQQEVQELNKAMQELDKKNFEAAKSHFESAIDINAENADAWHGLAISLQNLDRIQEAIAAFNHAMAIMSGFALEDLKIYEDIVSYFKQIDPQLFKEPSVYSVLGEILRKLGFYQEAVVDYNKAFRHFNEDDPYNYLAYTGSGSAFRKLGRYQEAISNYDRAIGLKPDYYLAYCNRGDILKELKRYQEAISDYNEAIRLQPNNYFAYNGRGNIYRELERYQEAISDYNKAIRLQPNNHLAYNNRGAALRKLRLINEAISDFNQALQLSRNQNWRAWVNLGWTYFQDLEQYEEALRIWDKGLQELERLQQLQPNPEYNRGRGELYWCKGKANYRYGRLQHKPYEFWLKAYDNYELALNILKFEVLPERQLEVWNDLIQVSPYLKPEGQIKELLRNATDLLRRLQVDQLPEEKIRLERKFASFSEIGVDIEAQNGNGRGAVELAEKRKNVCLAWMQGDIIDSADGSPNYDQIQQLLNFNRAVIYWHLSPSALTTFILKDDREPIVYTLEPDPNILGMKQTLETHEILNRAILPKTVERLNKFEKWMDRWKSKYEMNRKQIKDTKKNDAGKIWQKEMSNELDILTRILQIEDIINNLQVYINEIIIIPHRDLHLLPLEALFPEKFTITRLPSAKIGLDLQKSTVEMGYFPSLLSIEHPKSSQPLLFAEIESAMLANFVYKYKEAYVHRIVGANATKERVLQALQVPFYNILHFTGHAEHNIDLPLDSALELAKQERLTMSELFNLRLHNYYLVCLSACETGLTSKSNIIDEFVGLVSSFLAKGTNYVVSTLWTVDEISSALIMIEFYRWLKAGETPSKALKQAKHWLRTITYSDLAKWYKERAAEVEDYDLGCCENLESAASNAEQEANKHNATHCPYTHPYYWAGFTVTGKVSTS